MDFESKPSQFIPLWYEFLDSQLVEEWDKRGIMLYFKMRRYVCRSEKHKLGAYWKSGYLATYGYQNSWAKWLRMSRSTVSRLIQWMIEKNIIVEAQKSQAGGDPNIYVLGKVIHIAGSEKPVEMFFLDHNCLAQEKAKTELNTNTPKVILPYDIQEIEHPLITIAPMNESLAWVNESLAPMHTFNKEYSNRENLILPVVKFYKANISKQIEPIILQELEQAVNQHGPDLVIEAIAIAVKAKVKTWRYIDSVLKNKANQPQRDPMQQASDGGFDF